MAESNPLHEFVVDGDLEKVKQLIERGCDVNVRGCHGATPLHRAAGFGHYCIAYHLLDNKADVNAKNNDGYTPLHFSTREEISTLLKLHGAIE